MVANADAAGDVQSVGVPSGRRATMHILMPPMTHLRVRRGRLRTLRLANRVGITAAEEHAGRKRATQFAALVPRIISGIGDIMMLMMVVPPPANVESEVVSRPLKCSQISPNSFNLLYLRMSQF
jgi:hypothetical protein